MMKKRMLLLVVLSIPVLLYLNVWQAVRYRDVETEIHLLETKQEEWIEANKKVIIGIEVLGAPSRINNLATGMDELSRHVTPEAIRIKVDRKNGAGNG